MSRRFIGLAFRSARLAAGLSLATAGVGVSQAAITAQFTGGILTVTSDADDFIALSAADGDSPVQGLGAGGPVVLARDVTTIRVTGGPLANLITLQAVSATNFPNLTLVEINGGGAADQIFGSAVRDEIRDNDGGDSISGDAGANLYTVDLANNGATTEIIGGAGKLIAIATGGDDAITILADRVNVNARTVTFVGVVTEVAVQGAGGSDTFATPAFTSLTLNLEGGDGSDVLNFDAAGAAATNSGLAVTQTGKAPVNHAGIETVNLLNLPGGGGSNANGNTNSGGGNTNTNGSGSDGNANANSGGGGGQNANSNGSDDGTGDDGDGGNDDGISDDDGTGDDVVGDLVNGAECGACGAGFAPLLPLTLLGMLGLRVGRWSRRMRD